MRPRLGRKPGTPGGFYERWKTNAKPLGYKLKAEVLNYPKGIIGEIGLFVE